MSKDKVTTIDLSDSDISVKFHALRVETDTRIAFGMACSWWDNITKARNNMCPYCGGMLYVVESETIWWDTVVSGAKNFDTPFSNVELQKWLRGRSCYDSLVNANTAFEILTNNGNDCLSCVNDKCVTGPYCVTLGKD